MAETTSITSMQELADFLDSLGFFGSVTVDADGSMKMKNAAENLLASIASNGLWTVYTASGGSVALTSSAGLPKVAVKCSGGAVLHYALTNGVPSNANQVLLTKDVNENIVFAYHGAIAGASSGILRYDTAYKAVSWHSAYTGVSQVDQYPMNQMILNTIFTFPSAGIQSYCTDAFLLFGTESNDPGSFTLADKRYYSSGWFAVADEGVTV